MRTDDFVGPSEVILHNVIEESGTFKQEYELKSSELYAGPSKISRGNAYIIQYSEYWHLNLQPEDASIDLFEQHKKTLLFS